MNYRTFLLCGCIYLAGFLAGLNTAPRDGFTHSQPKVYIAIACAAILTSALAARKRAQ